MKLIALLTGLVACSCIGAVDGADPPKLDSAQAKMLATKWLEQLGEKGLVLSSTLKQDSFVITHGRGALGPVTKFTLQQPGWQVALSFKGNHSKAVSVEQLRSTFWHAVIDRVPTPGLNLNGWDVRPRTPTSSFSKGVELLSYADGKIKFRVKTKFFAIYGRDPSVVVPADAGLPPNAYFQIRKSFPLDLTLEGPVVAK